MVSIDLGSLTIFFWGSSPRLVSINVEFYTKDGERLTEVNAQERVKVTFK